MESNWRWEVFETGWQHLGYGMLARVRPGFPNPIVTHFAQTESKVWYAFQPDIFINNVMTYTLGSGPHSFEQIQAFVVPDG